MNKLPIGLLLFSGLLLAACSSGSGTGKNAGFAEDSVFPGDSGAEGSWPDGQAGSDILKPAPDAADTGDLRSDQLSEDWSQDGTVDSVGEVAQPDVVPGPDAKDSVADQVTEQRDEPACVPTCDGLYCGPDSCGGTCDCQPGYACPLQEPWTCFPDCKILCTGRACGKAGILGECDCGSCDDLKQCTLDQCQPDGTCLFSDAAGPCSDGNPCTENDQCGGGNCRGTPLPLADLLAIGCVCAEDKECQALDDGDGCNGSLFCDRTGGVPVCATSPGSVPECNDGDPCTKDLCTAEDGCQNLPDEGAPCGDGDLCNGQETCSGGSCVAGSPPVCTGTECSTAACDPLQGCVLAPLKDGTLCGPEGGRSRCVSGECKCLSDCIGKTCGDDGCGGQCGVCRGTEKCELGVCSCTPNCSGRKCGSDGCGGTCGTCTSQLTCVQGLCACVQNCAGKECGNSCGTECGQCAPGWTCLDFKCWEKVECMVDADCNDSDPCTTDTCSSHACVHACAAGAICSDGNPTTFNDRCSADGSTCICRGEAECKSDEQCEDGNACTWDYCDQSGFCHHACTSQNCNDGNPYTVKDHCSSVAGGKCICTGAAVQCVSKLDCDDGNQCTEDSCDATGVCVHQCMAKHSCDDGVPNTTNDICSGDAGGKCSCAGTFFECLDAAPCNDGNECTMDVCNDLKCQHVCNRTNVNCGPSGSANKCKPSGVSCACTPVACTQDWHCPDYWCWGKWCDGAGNCQYWWACGD